MEPRPDPVVAKPKQVTPAHPDLPNEPKNLFLFNKPCSNHHRQPPAPNLCNNRKNRSGPPGAPPRHDPIFLLRPNSSVPVRSLLRLYPVNPWYPTPFWRKVLKNQ